MESPIRERPLSPTIHVEQPVSPDSSTPRQLPPTGAAPQNGSRGHSRNSTSTSSSKSIIMAKIGPYLLGKTLGTGSTGRVKLGTHIETGQKVAVKIIPKHLLKPKEKKDQKEKPPGHDEAVINKKLEREIAIMKLIQHPSIMSLYDVYESQDELYLILELVEGGELFDYLVRQGRLREDEALSFFQQIIGALDYCHKHLICHRDLKPENLLLDNQKRIKIADFGMASMQVTGKLLETSCGSPHYASPEIIRGVKYDGAAADIWSCGVILFALLSGNLPFDDDNIRRLLQKVKSGVYVIPDSVPQDAADLIRKMLVVNPAKRITIAEIEQHPWFTKMDNVWRNGNQGPLRNPPSPDSLKPIDESKEMIDLDIINSLSILGYGTEKEIIDALKKEEASYEKVFYWVLRQRKTELLENMDNDYDDPKQLRRRTGSRTSVFSDVTSANSSTEGLASPTLSKQSSTAALDTPPSPTRERAEEPSLRDSKTRSSYKPSPLSSTTKAEEGDGLNSESARKAREEALLALQGHRPSAPVEPIDLFGVSAQEPPPTPAKESSNRTSSLFNQFKNRLSLTPSGHDSKPSGTQHGSLLTLDTSVQSSVSSQNSLSLKTSPKPKSPIGNVASIVDSPSKQHQRKNTPGEISINTNQSTVISSMPALHQDINGNNRSLGSLDSPAISSAPKRSWFANLFQFKPESFTMHSSLSLEKTRENIEKKLAEFKVETQPSRDGISIKCKFDCHGTIPSVRFRIAMNFDAEGQIEIVFTHQQGPLSSFQIIYEKFRADWVA